MYCHQLAHQAKSFCGTETYVLQGLDTADIAVLINVPVVVNTKFLVKISGRGDRHDPEEDCRHWCNRGRAWLFSHRTRECRQRRSDTTGRSECRPTRAVDRLGW